MNVSYGTRQGAQTTPGSECVHCELQMIACNALPLVDCARVGCFDLKRLVPHQIPPPIVIQSSHLWSSQELCPVKEPASLSLLLSTCFFHCAQAACVANSFTIVSTTVDLGSTVESASLIAQRFFDCARRPNSVTTVPTVVEPAPFTARCFFDCATLLALRSASQFSHDRAYRRRTRFFDCANFPIQSQS